MADFRTPGEAAIKTHQQVSILQGAQAGDELVLDEFVTVTVQPRDPTRGLPVECPEGERFRLTVNRSVRGRTVIVNRPNDDHPLPDHTALDQLADLTTIRPADPPEPTEMQMYLHEASDGGLFLSFADDYVAIDPEVERVEGTVLTRLADVDTPERAPPVADRLTPEPDREDPPLTVGTIQYTRFGVVSVSVADPLAEEVPSR